MSKEITVTRPEQEAGKELLGEKLETIHWSHKKPLYAPFFENVVICNKRTAVKSSIVIIAAFANPDTVNLFSKLDKLDEREKYELIFVDNGCNNSYSKAVLKYSDIFICLTSNTGAYFARNVGSVFASGEILIFLDDDAWCHSQIIQEFHDAFDILDVHLVRGAILPKTDGAINAIAEHYYLDDSPHSVYANIEGNVAVSAETFFKIGGWDDEIQFGGGGVELSYRIALKDPDMRKLIYWPYAIIYHDYKRPLDRLAEKRTKQKASLSRIREKFPQIDAFRGQFTPLAMRPDILLFKDNNAYDKSFFQKKALEYFYHNEKDKLLADVLRLRGWQAKWPIITKWVKNFTRVDPKSRRKPLSIIVVVNDFIKLTQKCLDAVSRERSTVRDAEIVLVVPEDIIVKIACQLKHLAVDVVVKVKVGIDYYLACNIGAAFSSGSVLFFVAPNSVPMPGFLHEHISALLDGTKYVSIGKTSGSSQPSQPPASGDEVILTRDHNFAIVASVFYEVKGWTEGLPKGTAGVYLSAKIYAISGHSLDGFVQTSSARVLMPATGAEIEVSEMEKRYTLMWKVLAGQFEFSGRFIKDLSARNPIYGSLTTDVQFDSR
jgi:glycosyltransferase involved in cell wall biosynthesis